VNHPNKSGIAAALLTPVFLGMAPIFGKSAINAQADAFTVAAFRTIISVAILFVIYAIFMRRYLYIYPAGLLGCVVIGVINGIGSLFYYGGLSMLDASLVQLLNGMYIAFAVLLSHLDGDVINRRIIVRVMLALVALILLAGFGNKPVNWLGVGLMLGSALMFAGTMTLSQHVLFEMPPQTVALYVLSTMAVIVTMVWATVGDKPEITVLQTAMPPIVILGLTTALSRLFMFAGVKFLGSLQTAILAIAEIGVALTLAFIFLDEYLTTIQWLGVATLALSILLVRSSDLTPRRFNPGQMLIANMASVQFQKIAFHRAFGKPEMDNPEQSMSSLTTLEMKAIQNMLGAQNGPVDPFPIESGVSVDLSAFLPRNRGQNNGNAAENNDDASASGTTAESSSTSTTL